MATLLAAVVLGGVCWWRRPVEVPSIALQDSEGQVVTLADMRGDKDGLLLVFLIPGCEVSRFSLTVVKDLHAAHSSAVAFAGLFFGNQATAERFRGAEEIPFPVYGLKDARDPFAVQELIKKVGVSGLTGAGVYGGTVVLLDSHQRVRLRLEKEEVRELAPKLASALK